MFRLLDRGDGEVTLEERLGPERPERSRPPQPGGKKWGTSGLADKDGIDVTYIPTCMHANIHIYLLIYLNLYYIYTYV